MDTTPRIHYHSPDNYSSVWIKYVRFVDLTVHCINSLGGDRHRNVRKDQADQTLTLTEHAPAPAYYLCSVTTPYRWKDNGHLLAIPAPGETHTHQSARMTLELENLRPIQITPDCIDPTDPHNHDRLYNTCRNWQAAWWLHTNLALPNHINQDQFRYRRAKRPVTSPAQTTLL